MNQSSSQKCYLWLCILFLVFLTIFKWHFYFVRGRLHHFMKYWISLTILLHLYILPVACLYWISYSLNSCNVDFNKNQNSSYIASLFWYISPKVQLEKANYRETSLELSLIRLCWKSKIKRQKFVRQWPHTIMFDEF